MRFNRKRMIGRNRTNGRGYLRWYFEAVFQKYILLIYDVHQHPLLNTKEADVAHKKEDKKLENKKLVPTHPSATMGMIAYMGRGLFAADQALHRLFSEDR